MPLTVSRRLQRVESSPTLALAAKAKALAKAGKAVVDFTAGEPDFPTPSAAKQAGIRAIESNKTRYTAVEGILELRQAIADRTNQQCGTKFEAANVLVSCGAKHSLYNVFQALCEPGDEVLIISPYWVSYPPMAWLAGATPVIVESTEQDGFQPDVDALRSRITSRTRGVVLNSPSNPTGAVISADRLRSIAKLASERGLFVISDEIYADLVYAPAQATSILQVQPDIVDRTILVNGVSKSYSMTGWRIGYAVGPKEAIEAMARVQSHSTSNPTTISQYAALEALTGSQEPVAEMRRHFQRRRDLIVTGLNHLSPLRCFKADGAFYAWCDVRGTGLGSEVVAARWLDEALIATVPGDGFGAPGWIRFSFATSDETIQEGLSRIQRWLGGLKAGK